MKKIIFCDIPMKEKVDLSVYISEDRSLPASDTPVRYPVNAMLEKTASPEDEIKVVLLVKNDKYSFSKKNEAAFVEEINRAVSASGAKIDIVTVDTEFSQNKEVHERLMGRLVDEIEENSHIIVDITYGPKDIPVVIFAALGFAEKFLGCDIDNIVYGQASFSNGHAVNTRICDMSPLYYLSSVTNTIRCDNPENARKTLKTLLSL